MKPFERASWLRKLLRLWPIFISTRYSLTSLNFTSARPGPATSSSSFSCFPDLGLFLVRGRMGVWNMASVSENCHRRLRESVAPRATFTQDPGKAPTVVQQLQFISHLHPSFFFFFVGGFFLVIVCQLHLCYWEKKALATGAEDLVFTKNHLLKLNAEKKKQVWRKPAEDGTVAQKMPTHTHTHTHTHTARGFFLLKGAFPCHYAHPGVPALGFCFCKADNSECKRSYFKKMN